MEEVCLESLVTWLSQGSNWGLGAGVLVPQERGKEPISPPFSPSPGCLGTYHQLQGLVEEPVALAVQVSIGAACFGHTDPGEAGLL